MTGPSPPGPKQSPSQGPGTRVAEPTGFCGPKMRREIVVDLLVRAKSSRKPVFVFRPPKPERPATQSNPGRNGSLGWYPVEMNDASTTADTEVLPAPPPPRRRRIWRPIVLFLLTCVSAFIAGAAFWAPYVVFENGLLFRAAILTYWREGLIYSGCLLAILMTHEMGHFVATVLYRIPSSLPYFLPLPISPIGTLGAVIAMDGMRANRREIFDIGLAGPIAGLVVAVPILWIGVCQLDLTENEYGYFRLGIPWGLSLLLEVAQPPGYESAEFIWHRQLNPFFMAGWTGLLITGLNMLPVSQLDGGHVLYALFCRRAHWIARGFMAFALGFMIYTLSFQWIVMFLLVFFLLGADHPPTSDDRARLGPARIVLGFASLLIPLFCFPIRVMF